MELSKKALGISPSLTLEITAKAKGMIKEGIDVVNFGAGEPDFNTPENIQKKAILAIQKGYTRYTSASGIVELKKAICEKFKKDNGLSYNEEQIIISTGAKQCLSNVFQAILNEEDEVIIPNPCWVSYPELIKLYGGVPKEVNTKIENDFKYDISSLKESVSSKTKAILVNSPNNPTGAIYSKEELEKIAEFAKVNDLIIISDEIYEKLIYGDNTHVSIASLSEDANRRTIVINGVSKSYAMTGWRIGYAAGDKNIIKVMSNIQSHTTSNPTSISQYAALEALNGPQDNMKMMTLEFEKRRNYMEKKINSIEELSCVNPKGAFYIMINIEKVFGRKFNDKIISNSMEFAKLLLEEENVALIPGKAFGIDNYARVSYATSMEQIEKGINRINNFIKKLI